MLHVGQISLCKIIIVTAFLEKAKKESCLRVAMKIKYIGAFIFFFFPWGIGAGVGEIFLFVNV